MLVVEFEVDGNLVQLHRNIRLDNYCESRLADPGQWELTIFPAIGYAKIYNVPYAIVDRVIALAHKVDYQISMLSLQEG